MFKLAPSILAADFSALGLEIQKVESSGADYLHIDVMDGMFVPSISLGLPVIESIRKTSKLFFDVHLMIEKPERYIQDFVNAGADLISVHVEACTHLNRTIQMIKNAGAKACVALNPATPLSTLDYVLEDIDMVLLMSVNPGFGGQAFLPLTLEKIKDLRKMINERKLSIDIEVDGGISIANVEEVMKAGANVIVAGTSVFRGDATANVVAFKEVFERAIAGDEIR